jgi:two-component system, NarL family, response regulator NreC
MFPIRVLVADDHTIVRHGLVSLLRGEEQCEVVAQAADGAEAVERARETRPDVAVLDLQMPRLSGLEALRRIVEVSPRTRVLVLTMHDEEEYVVHVVRAGASGFLLKDSAASDLIAAVRALHAGQAWFGPYASRVLAEQTRRPQEGPADPYAGLTPREREVFHLVIEGRSTKEVARELGIRPKTAENHRSRMMAKLGAHGVADLVRLAARRGLLP